MDIIYAVTTFEAHIHYILLLKFKRKKSEHMSENFTNYKLGYNFAKKLTNKKQRAENEIEIDRHAIRRFLYVFIY
jgi:hypothetical protein